MADLDRRLPRGTLTFLFTDIEGSTHWQQRLGTRFDVHLAAHHEILRDTIAATGGTVVSTEGDSFFAVFPVAPQAVMAAVTAQRAIAAYGAEHGMDLRVRMGLHTGAATLGGDNYSGLEVVRAARISAAGHGGQVLLSEATQALVHDTLPQGVSVTTLGPYRLKDLGTPERIHQLVVDDLPRSFPPLRATDERAAHLPIEATSFIGRAGELGAIGELLAARRLVTLTGPGGSGKTRLAIRVARDLAERFREGARFVAAATITDPELLPAAVAAGLGVREDPGSPVADVVTEWLRDRDLLLVLDNLEQLAGAGRFVDTMLASATDLRILATSRAPVGVPGEQEFPVPPLAVPPQGADAADLQEADVVTLFVDRARLVRPGFTPEPDDLATIAAIGGRLDGLPLAIELAAARIRLLPPTAILERLGRRLDALSRPAGLVPRRQQSLREAIGWSHDLLNETERTVFRRLGIFVGGWTLDAAAEICAPGPTDVATTLEALVAQSLVQAVDSGGLRFTMLGTIGEFALEQLEASEESTAIRRRHIDFFRDLAERACAASRGPAAETWFDWLEADLDNLRAATERAAADGDIPMALAMAAALERFWLQRNHSAEGRRRLGDLIARWEGAPGPELARAAGAAANIDTWLGDYASGREMGRLSVDAYREIGDRAGMVDPMTALGFATIETDPEAALAIVDESFQIAREVGHLHALATIPLARAVAQFRLGRLTDARASLEEAVASSRQAGDGYFELMSRYALARTELLLGDVDVAVRRYRSTIEEAHHLNVRIAVVVGLDNFAEMAVWSRDIRRAVRLAASAIRMRDELGGAPPARLMGALDPLAEGRQQLAVDQYELECAIGRGLDVDAAVAEALATPPPTSAPPLPAPAQNGRP